MAFNLIQHLSSTRASVLNNRDVINDIITDEMTNEKLLLDRPFVYYRNWPSNATANAYCGVKRAIAKKAVVIQAEPLPTSIESEIPLTSSRLNVYSVHPPAMNRWEKDFAKLLDGDDTASVLWWHRMSHGSRGQLSLGASNPATHGRFKTSRGVNVQ